MGRAQTQIDKLSCGALGWTNEALTGCGKFQRSFLNINLGWYGCLGAARSIWISHRGEIGKNDQRCCVVDILWRRGYAQDVVVFGVGCGDATASTCRVLNWRGDSVGDAEPGDDI